MSPAYRMVRALVRALVRLFYRRVDVVGLERVPATAPLIVAANHHNSVVDAMLLIAVFPRRLRTLANAPLFAHPLIGPFLKLLGALPVHRRQEAGNDPARNTALFDATTATLREGGAILIFPEGRTQPEPVLLELRTGAARMLLAAEEGGCPPVTLQPVGLVFDDPGTFREGEAVVLVGEPVLHDGGTDPRALTDQLADALREQLVEAGDRRTLSLLDLVEEIWRSEGGAPVDGEGRIDWMRRAMRTYALLREREGGRMATFRAHLEEFDTALRASGLTPHEVGRTTSWATALGFVLREGLALVVAAPFAILGIVLHALPYNLTEFAVRRIPHTDEEEATDKIAAGLLMYPLCWAIEAFVALRVFGAPGAAALLLLLIPSGLVALAWRERLERVARAARVFAREQREPGYGARLAARRRALAGELAALAALAPEAWAEERGA
jgi:glycerol-3-phosphate O-acyltransferase/dihydroxyacetone phosphate acyltransferase